MGRGQVVVMDFDVRHMYVHIHIWRLTIVHIHMVRYEWDCAINPKLKGDDVLAKSIAGSILSSESLSTITSASLGLTFML